MQKIIILIFIFTISAQNTRSQPKTGNTTSPIYKKSTSHMELKVYQTKETPNIKKRILHQELQFVNIEVHLKRTLSLSEAMFSEVYSGIDTLVTEDFESAFPTGNWSVFDGDGTAYGEYYWGVDYTHSNSLTYSAWCAADGQAALQLESNLYPNNCNSWMVYGPIDLSHADTALVKFSTWLNSKKDHDYLCWIASIDSIEFYGQGISGTPDENWQDCTFDLTNVYKLGNLTGEDNVWLAFLFFSDEADSAEGAYLDDIFIKSTSSPLLNIKLNNVIADGFPIINAYVSVTDQEKDPIEELLESNFVILERGIRQNSISLIPEDKSVNAALALDFSGSMKDDTTYMKKAANLFVDSMKVADKAAIFKFANKVFKVQSLTSDKSLLHNAINADFSGNTGKTALYKAIVQSIAEVGSASGIRAVIAITDGKDRDASYTVDAVIDSAIQYQTSVFTIGLGDSISEEVLEKIANRTGGNFYPTPDAAQLPGIYQAISNLLANHYCVSYTTDNPVMDGKKRNILIELNYENFTGLVSGLYQAPLQDSLTLRICDDIEAQSGDTINIPINIENVNGNTKIVRIQVDISYETHVLEAIEVTTVNSIAKDWGEPAQFHSPGQSKFIMSGNPALSQNGKLVDVVFKVTGKHNDSTDIKFDRARINNGIIETETSDGFLKVDGIHHISGKVGYYSNFNSLPVENVKLSLTGCIEKSVFTNGNGKYKFINLPSCNLTVCPVIENANGKSITPNDALQVLLFTEGDTSLSTYQMIAGDVNGDCILSKEDAVEILSYYTSARDSFSIGSYWTFVPHNFPIDNTNWCSAPKCLYYNPLDRFMVDQNFFAIQYGDVDKSWKPSEKLGKNVIDDSLISHLKVEDIIESTSGKMSLPINLKNVTNIYSFSLTLENIPEKLSVVSVDTTELTGGYLLLYHEKNQVVNIAAAGTKSINGSGSVCFIEFEVLGTIKQSVNEPPLVITKFSLNGIQAVNLYKQVNISTIVNVPVEYKLSQNYPNPFNLHTVIKYQLPEDAQVKIEIYNLMGQRVRVLMDEKKQGGYFQVNWNGQNDLNHIMPSGIYFCRLQANHFVSIRKIALLK